MQATEMEKGAQAKHGTQGAGSAVSVLLLGIHLDHPRCTHIATCLDHAPTAPAAALMSRKGTTHRQAGPPPLLARLYGEGNVVCLRELLLRLSDLSREAAPLTAALVQPHDHADYAQVRSRALGLYACWALCVIERRCRIRKRGACPGAGAANADRSRHLPAVNPTALPRFCSQELLEHTWCVLRPGAPPLRDGFSLSQASSQQQVSCGWAWRQPPPGVGMCSALLHFPHEPTHPSLCVQLLGRAVEALLRLGQQKTGGLGGGGNVLCYGFRKKRPTGAPCGWPAWRMRACPRLRTHC